MMKPKAQSEHEEGMLEYLEDIIGSSRFKEPIEQLTNEVENLNEARGEKVLKLIQTNTCNYYWQCDAANYAMVKSACFLNFTVVCKCNVVAYFFKL